MASFSKFFLKSKTILGIIIAAVPTVANFIDSAAPFVPPQYQEVVRVVGLAVATIGRWTAHIPLNATGGNGQ